jgi:hypothetical protein
MKTAPAGLKAFAGKMRRAHDNGKGAEYKVPVK